MRKKLWCVLLVSVLFLQGCTWRGNRQENAGTENGMQDMQETEVEKDTGGMGTLLDEYVSNLEGVETSVHEYGEGTAYIQQGGTLGVRIAYPETDILALDEKIQGWIKETVAFYEIEAEALGENSGAAELTADYESYLADGIVSVKIKGLFDMSYIAHPIDVVAAFHADAFSGKLLEIEDILVSGGRDLLQNMVIRDAGIDAEVVDEHLLKNWALKEEGLEIVLERGDYLPMSEGSVTLCYSYEELQNVLTLLHTDEKIDPARPMVALTFDDGPGKYTETLLDILDEYNVKATFFMIGSQIDDYTEAVKRMSEEGHEVAGHTWSHRQLTKLKPEEMTDQIMTTRAKIYEVAGVDTMLVRPPYGSYNDKVKKVCGDLGVILVNWSVDTLDWKSRNADKVYDAIMQDVENGAIVLCHDLYDTTVEAVERVIPELLEQGYQFVTVSELLSYGEKEVSAGMVVDRQ